MKKLSLVVVLFMLVSTQLFLVTDAQASDVLISEFSYVRITSFQAWYLYSFGPWDPVHPVEWKGFDVSYAQSYESTPTIEPKLVNFVHPELPPADGWYGSEQNGILFDCHGGYASVGDYASVTPVVLCGGEPWTRVEFDWDSKISSAAAPYVCIEIAGYEWMSYEKKVAWRLWPGVGAHSGHVVADLLHSGIVDAVELQLAVQPVPEPGSVVALSFGLGWLMVKLRKGL